MKSTLILIIILFSSVSHAGVNLLIEHPRNPNQLKDRYKVECAKKCALEIEALNPIKGQVDEKFESKVKELWSLAIPKEIKLRDSGILYTISATDGDKTISFKIGHPDNYDGEELSKYLEVINYIEGLKRNMRSELQAGKK